MASSGLSCRSFSADSPIAAIALVAAFAVIVKSYHVFDRRCMALEISSCLTPLIFAASRAEPSLYRGAGALRQRVQRRHSVNRTLTIPAAHVSPMRRQARKRILDAGDGAR